MTRVFLDGLLCGMKAKALVTGAAGFIGSHLVDSLSADGIPVKSFVRPNCNLSNLQGSDSEIIYGDIKDPHSLHKAMEDVDIVYHMAAVSRHDVNVPKTEYHAINVEGTKNVLEAAKSTGVKRLVFTSTIEAVGMSKGERPLNEDTSPAPMNIYGKTKLEAEILVRAYHIQHGMDTVVVRPPMTYGPRDLILCQRLFKIIQHGFYPIIGNGQALTEFCFVKNQVHGIRLAAEKGKAGEVYFISDDHSYTIEEIIKAIALELGVRVATPHIPVPLALAIGLIFELLSKILRFYPFVIPQTGRPPFSRKTVEWTSESRLYCDISKAKKELGYKPQYSLGEGIRETVRWYKEHGHLR